MNEKVARFEHRKGRMYAESKGKTLNPFIGCRFDCTYCGPSFRRQAKRRGNRCPDCYNYTPHKHLERLRKSPPKTYGNEFIFLCDMGDISFAPADVTQAIIDYAKRYADRTFLIQSKNPKYFQRFEFPENVILGTTIETTRKTGEISKAPATLERYKAMVGLNHSRKTVTIEPILDFDMDTMVSWLSDIKPEAVYIGYDSHPKENHLSEPPLAKTLELGERLRKITEVRYKLMRGAWWE